MLRFLGNKIFKNELFPFTPVQSFLTSVYYLFFPMPFRSSQTLIRHSPNLTSMEKKVAQYMVSQVRCKKSAFFLINVVLGVFFIRKIPQDLN